MVFTRFVEVGRVAVVTYGPDVGKMCVIVDIIDQSRALVDGPVSAQPLSRQPLTFRRLQLTPYKVEGITRSMSTKNVKKVLEKQEFVEKVWSGSSWAKKAALRQKRLAMSDFDRFKLKQAKQAKRKILTA